MKNFFKSVLMFIASSLLYSPFVPFVLFVLVVQGAFHVFDYDGCGFADQLSFCLESGDPFYQYFVGVGSLGGCVFFLYIQIFWDFVCFLSKNVLKLIGDRRKEKNASGSD